MAVIFCLLVRFIHLVILMFTSYCFMWRLDCCVFFYKLLFFTHVEVKAEKSEKKADFKL